ncbi:ABC transporter permease [Natronorubrum sp. DTA28]|uniref:ABC transporter permease n=1 Tax=Natronorubrum sp. DTA28 TaxID=3447019 RepID=UPI003F8467A0
MKAFEPEPTQSPAEIANWVFTRSVLILVFTYFGAIYAVDLFAPLGTAAGVVVGTYGLWFSYQVLFRGIDAFLEGKAAGLEDESAS